MCIIIAIILAIIDGVNQPLYQSKKIIFILQCNRLIEKKLVDSIIAEDDKIGYRNILKNVKNHYPVS